MGLLGPRRGAEQITLERRRQVDVEGWDREHDKEHGAGELLGAAMCYAATVMPGGLPAEFAAEDGSVPEWWPWEPEWWKPSADPIRNLVIAGALIAAEIDRLQDAARG